MKQFRLILICILFASLTAKSYYYKTFLWQLIENSDVIVSGKIIAINDQSFKILLIDKIKCSDENDTLTILKFKDWSCAKRYSKYLVGQCGIYFLKNRNGKYEISGNANEGELILVQDNIYIKDRTGYEYLNISHFDKFKLMSYGIVMSGIDDYLQNQNQINLEFQNYFSRSTRIINSFLDKPFKSEFLELILNERMEYPNINLR